MLLSQVLKATLGAKFCHVCPTFFMYFYNLFICIIICIYIMHYLVSILRPNDLVVDIWRCSFNISTLSSWLIIHQSWIKKNTIWHSPLFFPVRTFLNFPKHLTFSFVHQQNMTQKSFVPIWFTHNWLMLPSGLWSSAITQALHKVLHLFLVRYVQFWTVFLK